MNRFLLVGLLASLVTPVDAALTIDVASDIYNASPETGALISATLTMPCVDVVKEEAEGLADPFRLGGERPPALFQFEVWPEDTDHWTWGTVLPPDAPAYVAYYVPDFDYCHANPSDSLQYHAVFSVQPRWGVAAMTTMNATVSASVVGTDAWFYGPNPYGEATVAVEVQPVLTATVQEDSSWPPWLEVGATQEFMIPIGLRSNYDVSVAVDTRRIQMEGECLEGKTGSATYPVNVTSSPPLLVERSEGAWPYGRLAQHTVSVFLLPEHSPDGLPQECILVQQKAEVPIRITPSEGEGISNITDATLNSTLVWRLKTPGAVAEDGAAIDYGHPMPGLPAVLVVIGIAIALARIRRSNIA